MREIAGARKMEGHNRKREKGGGIGIWWRAQNKPISTSTLLVAGGQEVAARGARLGDAGRG